MAIEERLVVAQAPVKQGEKLLQRVVAVYRRHLLQLEEALRSENDRQRTRQILADLLGQVTLLRDEATGESFAEFGVPAKRLLWRRPARF